MTSIPWAELEPLTAERLLAALLIRTVVGAYAVDGTGGDDGADVTAPADGGVHIYEIKSFALRLTPAQRRQVERSVTTARAKRLDMVRWTLVMPLDPSPAEERWLTGRLAELAGVPVAWMGRTSIEAAFAERPDLARAFLPGSAQQQALEWLAQLRQEEAGLTAGVPGAIRRGAKLREQVKLIDPDYDFDLELTAGGQTVSVRPKDAGALQRRPIQTGMVLAAAVGSPEAAAIEDFHLYGAPLELSGDNIADVAVDLPGGLNALLEGATVTSMRVGPAEPEDRRARIVATTDGAVLAKLPVTIVETTRGPAGGARIVAVDDARAVRLEMRLGPEPALTGELAFSMSVTSDHFPEDALPGARFTAALAAADALRLEMPDTPPARMRLPDTTAVSAVGAGDLVAMLEALQRVQDATGTPFPVPEQMLLLDRQMLTFADGLLTRGEVEWWWPGFTVTLPAHVVRDRVLPGGAIPRIGMTGSGSAPVVIAGHEVPLDGTIVMEAKNVVVTNPLTLTRQLLDPRCRPESPLVVHLEADAATKVVFRLDSNAPPR